MAPVYENLIRPILFRMEPEQAHDRGRSLLMALGVFPSLCGLLRGYNLIREEKPIRLWGLEFPNRVGLAAGMDKDGEFPRAIEALGFGFSEVGTVTPKPQPGNSRPRLFRIPEKEALINRMGFNNKGAEAMAETLSRHFPKNKRRMPVGVNIGKGKATVLDHAVDDYLAGFRMLADQADYFAINVSSPNTEGLRDLQGCAYLRELLGALRAENVNHAKKLGRSTHPLLLKIAPDVSYRELDRILEISLENEFQGIIATNTTVERPPGFPSKESGGLSGGRFLAQRSTDMIRYIYQSTGGKLPIIGVGGVDSPESAGEKLDAGASLVQIYTSWVYRGPFHARVLAKALRARGADWI